MCRLLRVAEGFVSCFACVPCPNVDSGCIKPFHLNWKCSSCGLEVLFIWGFMNQETLRSLDVTFLGEHGLTGESAGPVHAMAQSLGRRKMPKSRKDELTSAVYNVS